MDERYIQLRGELFEALQLAEIFPDSKTVPDSTPLGDPQAILQSFLAARHTPGFDLREFFDENFEVGAAASQVQPAPAPGMRAHIQAMWPALHRPASAPPPASSLIALPFPYVVPGGRFNEIYYWDSYFTSLGLVAGGHADWVEQMAANFAHLIDRFGHVPNGNRVYYQSRSQPPFFCCMLQLIAQARGRSAAQRFLPQLAREYAFWMDGAEALAAPGAHRRVLAPAPGLLLNRYWDDRDEPREESFREDRRTWQAASEDRRQQVYRNLRAGAESGWDFSSRWLRAPDWKLSDIRTTEIAPVDLACLLGNVEQQLAAWQAPRSPEALGYTAAAERRRATLDALFWSEQHGWFCDYDSLAGHPSDMLTLAGMFPLFFGFASEAQARRVAARVESDFLQPGGVVTSLHHTGQQWDAPNGWAPLQWVTAQGLRRYGYEALAREIAQRFMALAGRVFGETGKMMEKYDVCDLTRPAGGGEYPNQDGFGWTNGVVEAFSQQFSIPAA
jgi:alpha,alpha-trehalase